MLSLHCTGSPPQVRGKRGNMQIGVIVCRDHPRRCGENCICVAESSARVGSPPQVRGKRVCTYVAKSRRRITPAGAGKTVGGTVGGSAIEDHPRRCGENWHIKAQI